MRQFHDALEIRPIRSDETMLLTDFLYEAIFQPGDAPKVPRTVLQEPMIMAYVKNFWALPDDFCLVAVADGLIVGAAWSRRGCSYGKIDDITPELAIAVYPEYRNRGIGSRLLSALLECLCEKGYAGLSLSVDKANYAVNMYRKAGFVTVKEQEHDYLMIRHLRPE